MQVILPAQPCELSQELLRPLLCVRDIGAMELPMAQTRLIYTTFSTTPETGRCGLGDSDSPEGPSWAALLSHVPTRKLILNLSL